MWGGRRIRGLRKNNGLEKAGYTVAEELEEAYEEAGCADGIDDGKGGGTGGIFDIRVLCQRKVCGRRWVLF